jgi:hypothetical protein
MTASKAIVAINGSTTSTASGGANRERSLVVPT